jgi:3-oxoacyl-[acyl-carrier-protein] synthase III
MTPSMNSNPIPASGRSCSITGAGSYVPEKILTNAELERMVETSDEWITSRTGIKERRIAAADEFTSDMAAKAALRAMAAAGVSVEQIDLIIVATITPDMLFPSTACLVQQKIGAAKAIAFDIEAACSGFAYALEIGRQFVQSGAMNTVLVIGAEKLSSIIDWTDRGTCVLFGDGAGAAILQHRPGSRGILSSCLRADGSKGELLCMPGGGSRMPATAESVSSRLHFLRMDGKETFKSAVNAMLSSGLEALRRAGLTIQDIKLVIPHQANRRIIDAVGDRLEVAPEQVFVNVDRYGNTSAASVAIALDEAASQGRLQRGDLVLLLVFGAGLTWGATVFEW